MTHTHANLEISKSAYDEIRGLLTEAEYQHAFNDDGAIDMHGIALVSAPAQDGRPLIIGVESDQLVIRIGVDVLANCFEIGEGNNPFNEELNDYQRTWKVIDKHEFAKGVAGGLREEEEDGSTPLTKILDAAFTRAVENDMGVDVDNRIVTADMLNPQTTR